jgi:hypothetical protein
MLGPFYKLMSYAKIALAALFLVLASTSAYAASIPKMEGEMLDKTEVVFPRDFKGKPTMMVMSFDQDQQEQANGWATGLKDLPDDVALLEIAVIGKVNGMVKFFIKGGMRDGLKDDKKRLARMMPYFGDAEKLKKRLKVTDSTQVHAFLLSASGKVLWQASGDYTGQFTTLPAPPYE